MRRSYGKHSRKLTDGRSGKTVAGFVRDAEQFDDLTMMSVEYRGPDGRE